MKKRRAGKAKRLSMDRISALPQPIIEIILSLLPTHEAARTSILAREWRYKWTKISKLEFSHYDWLETTTRKKIGKICPIFSYIHQVILLHRGPIHELTLQICDDCDSYDFDQIILHLMKNHTLKKLKLHGWNFEARFDIPKSIFLLHHLTDLDLYCVNLEHQPVFNGFGSLRSLVLDDVGISAKTLLHLLSNSPSLKSFNLHVGETHSGNRCKIVKLFKCLPVIEHLTTYRYAFMFWLDLGLLPQELPSFLFHLKYFCFEQMSFFDRNCLPFLLVLIKCAPNLEKIKIEIEEDDYNYEEYPIVWEEYSDVWLENLIELEIEWFCNLKLEMEFVKFILVRSPKLKNVRLRSVVNGNQESKMLKTLLQAPRVSPVIITIT